MGLCKCDRKKVTNLFCFEHRVNVCEHCLISDHPNCIVQSYLTWLQDSDYDASCLFCGKNLCDDTQETVRLLCLHLYHSSCFDAWARQLPPNTAPAGYACSICYEPVFPKANQVSPLVDDLKQKLAKFPWAKAGLGLSFASPEYNAGMMMMNSDNNRPIGKDAQMKMMPDTVLPVDADTTPNVRKQITTSADMSFLNQHHPSLIATNHNLDTDNPDVKYKRRSAFDFLGRWLKSKNIRRPTVQPWTCKRMFFYMLLLVIGVMTVITVLSRSSRHGGIGESGSHGNNEDPFLDPAANPHIHNVGPDKMAAD